MTGRKSGLKADASPDVYKRQVAGSLDMETLAEHLKIDIPEEDFDTVGGLVFSQLSTIPPDGSTPEVVVDGLWIKVEELKDKRVVWARVSQIMTVEPESSPEAVSYTHLYYLLNVVKFLPHVIRKQCGKSYKFSNIFL